MSLWSKTDRHTMNEFRPRWWWWWYVSIFNLSAFYRGWLFFLPFEHSFVFYFVIAHMKICVTTHFSFIYFVLFSFADCLKMCMFFSLFHRVISNEKHIFFFFRVAYCWIFGASGLTRYARDVERERVRERKREIESEKEMSINKMSDLCPFKCNGMKRFFRCDFSFPFFFSRFFKTSFITVKLFGAGIQLANVSVWCMVLKWPEKRFWARSTRTRSNMCAL